MKKETSILTKRVYAFTTDLAIIVVSNYFLMASFTHFIQTIFFHFPLRTQIFLISKIEVMTSISLMSLTFAYFSLFYFLTNGHTMGKIFFGLKVHSPSGDMSLKQAIMRSLAYFACAMTGSFLFALSYIRKDQKSLADVFSGTTVTLDYGHEESIGTEFGTVLETSMLMIHQDEGALEDLPNKIQEKEAA